MRKPDIHYRGFTMSWNEYQGYWAIYKDGESMSWKSKPNEADAKRAIDKYLKGEDD
jgi:hypothetical protein